MTHYGCRLYVAGFSMSTPEMSLIVWKATMCVFATILSEKLGAVHCPWGTLWGACDAHNYSVSRSRRLVAFHGGPRPRREPSSDHGATLRFAAFRGLLRAGMRALNAARCRNLGPALHTDAICTAQARSLLTGKDQENGCTHPAMSHS